MDKLRYLQRIFIAYILRRHSHLNFWHERPAVNQRAVYSKLGEYYMTFADKAEYTGSFDHRGVPLLDYHGSIGKQYNPIAIAQYGLANLNVFYRTARKTSFQVALCQADWLIDNLTMNLHGVPVWNHLFDFEYDPPLKAPWYAGLAQGQGISLLARIFTITGDETYLHAALAASQALFVGVAEGGVMFYDQAKNPWIEEYIVDPPSHILNGFIWALWGVYDLWLVTGDKKFYTLFLSCAMTLERNLPRYDLGYWTTYQLKKCDRFPMIASLFYHRLHCVQLHILAKMTTISLFEVYAKKWERYLTKWNIIRSQTVKAFIKLFYY